MNRSFPHCNSEVLHAPGTCQYCDDYPDRQAERAASGATFSPAEANGWHGNVAQPFKDWGSSESERDRAAKRRSWWRLIWHELRRL